MLLHGGGVPHREHAVEARRQRGAAAVGGEPAEDDPLHVHLRQRAWVGVGVGVGVGGGVRVRGRVWVRIGFGVRVGFREGEELDLPQRACTRTCTCTYSAASLAALAALLTAHTDALVCG